MDSQSQNATREDALTKAAKELAGLNVVIMRGVQAEVRAVKVIREYQASVGHQKEHMIALAEKVGLHVSTLYRWLGTDETAYREKTVRGIFRRQGGRLTAAAKKACREIAESGVSPQEMLKLVEPIVAAQPEHESVPSIITAIEKLGLVLPFNGDGTEHVFIEGMAEVLRKVDSPEWLTTNRVNVSILSSMLRDAVTEFSGYLEKLDAATNEEEKAA
jgi:hypothetical protein